MAWCLTASSHYMNQCWPSLSSMMSYGTVRERWVKRIVHCKRNVTPAHQQWSYIFICTDLSKSLQQLLMSWHLHYQVKSSPRVVASLSESYGHAALVVIPGTTMLAPYHPVQATAAELKNSTSRFHLLALYDDVIRWEHVPCYWPFVRGIHRSLVNSPPKGQWCGALMFSLICAWIKRLSKQSWGWWFETPSCSLWRHCNERISSDLNKTTGYQYNSTSYGH